MKKKRFRFVSLMPKLLDSLDLFKIELISVIFISFASIVLLDNISIALARISSIFNTLSFLLFVPWGFGVFKLWQSFLRHRKTLNNSIAKNLKWFLSSHNLYKQNGDTITYSSSLGFYEDSEKIIIRAIKDGGAFSENMNAFDNDLSSLLGMSLDNKVDTINYCDYVFSKNQDSRIVLDGSAKSFNNSTVIPLSSNLSWNIVKQPHLLLAGVTGSGKTTFLNYLIFEMRRMKATVYVCDPKRSDLGSLKHVFGDEFVGTDANNIAKITRIVKEKMEQRFIDYKENEEKFVYGNSFVDYGLKPIFIVFDELGAFRAGADKKVFAETMSNLFEIILKGREMGIFSIIATQQPNSQNIPTELRDNLSVRIFLGSGSAEAYRMVFGEDIKDLQSVSAVGTGYIYLDGLGWSKPKLFKAPFLDYKNFNFLEELKKY
ncbi:MAG: AAA family ATPase [Ruminococcaceae bacterium]|nr:AAA family ATPase [Oscillospiraceae bacterium]